MGASNLKLAAGQENDVSHPFGALLRRIFVRILELVKSFL